jgi:hypothetical protein
LSCLHVTPNKRQFSEFLKKIYAGCDVEMNTWEGHPRVTVIPRQGGMTSSVIVGPVFKEGDANSIYGLIKSTFTMK